jgi:hypothetical protein
VKRINFARRGGNCLSRAFFFATLGAMQRFLFCFCLALCLPVCGAEIKINFNVFSEGSTPTNFYSALAGGGSPGSWKIVMDEVPSAFAQFTPQAPIINHQGVLAQTSQDATDEHFPMFVYDGGPFRDFKAAVRFKIVSGITEQMAGLVFRYQNASNFYVVRASALGHNVRFYKMVNGVRSDPLGPQIDIAAGAWHTLAVQCQGNQIFISLDDQPVMPPLQDNTFAAGKIGLWTKSDAVSYFSDLTIDYTPLIPAAQALVNSIMEKQPRILDLRIYALDDKGQPHIIASKDEKEIGQLGTDAEKDAIASGKVYYGKNDGVDAITLPFRDRNGEPMAAVRVRLKSFFGETQDNAVTRATLLIKTMQAQITTSDDLLK